MFAVYLSALGTPVPERSTQAVPRLGSDLLSPAWSRKSNVRPYRGPRPLVPNQPRIQQASWLVRMALAKTRAMAGANKRQRSAAQAIRPVRYPADKRPAASGGRDLYALPSRAGHRQ